MVNMNRLPIAKRAQFIGLMVEGMSSRAIYGVTGASKNTIVKLLAEVGGRARSIRMKGCEA